MTTFNPYPADLHRKQRGVALITSLILLVVMTLLGLAAIRSVTQEERMAGHSYSRSLGFQSSESALRTVEELVEANKPTKLAGAGCSVVSNVMTCEPPGAGTARWLDPAFTSWTAMTAIGTGTLAVTPQYFVEYLGGLFPCDPADLINNLVCKRYRITVRSSDGSDGKTSVMLQSMYATD
jgi:type IV pilus assembly protein PilX